MFNAAASLAIQETWLRRGRFVVLAALLNLALYNLYQIIYSPTRLPDFAYFYAFARAGLTYGDQKLYDPIVQLTSLRALFPAAEFYAVVNPPPFAWLLAPIAIMPYFLALSLWTASMVAAVAISSQLLAPNKGYPRTLFMSSWLGFLPAFLLFVSAPLAPLVMLSLAMTWKFIRAERPVAAGLVLAIGLLKPTLVILIPFALLAAGHRRVFASWLVAAIVLIGASCAALGLDGINAYARMSANFASDAYSLRWSLVPFVGDGVPWLVAACLISVWALWLARRLRHDGCEAVMAVGVMASFLVNHHATPGDLMILLVPIWLVLGSHYSASNKTFVGGAWIAAWLGLIFPVSAIVAAAAIPLFLLARNVWSLSTSAFKSSEQAVFVPSLTPRSGDILVTAEMS
jgi:hypothetical protein